MTPRFAKTAVMLCAALVIGASSAAMAADMTTKGADTSACDSVKSEKDRTECLNKQQHTKHQTKYHVKKSKAKAKDASQTK